MGRPRSAASHAKPMLVALLAVAILLPLSCVSGEKIEGQEARGLDKTLATFVFMEKGKLVTLLVGTRAARYRENSPYVPFEISIANHGVRKLTLTRESFTLIDSDGNRYPVAEPKELLQGYNFLDVDRNAALAELDGLTFDRYRAYTRYEAGFSPTLMLGNNASSPASYANQIVRDVVTLPRYGFLIDYIYFPHPETGVKGKRFELFVKTPELEDAVFVRFEVR